MSVPRYPVCLVCLLFLPALPAAAQWTTQPQALTTNELFDVRMPDASRGYIVGEGNVLLCTQDGGLPWTGLGSAAPDLTAASLTPSGALHFANLDGAVFFEDDPATCDNELLAPAVPAMGGLTDLHSLGGGKGYAVTAGGLRYTDDDWSNSTAVASTTCGYDFVSAWFPDPALGFAGTDDGQVVSVAFLAGYWLCEERSGPGETIRALHFANPDHGWAVGDGGRVMRTTDAGASWTAAPFPRSEDLRAVFATDPATVHVAGNGIYRSEDGGATWSQTWDPAAGPRVNALWFVDPNRGWAVGQAGWIGFTDHAGGGGTVLGFAAPGGAIRVFPNPASGRLRVEAGPGGTGRWELADAAGRTVRAGEAQGEGFAIPTRGLPPGIYALRWSRGAVAVVRRVVVH